MSGIWIVGGVSIAYLGVLFLLAFYGDRRANVGRSLINNGTVYTLSLAVYVNSWMYYGGVGTATAAGVGFLPIYLGPTLMLALGWPVLRRIIRISRRDRITSLADFLSARYGRSSALGSLVTIIAVIGIVPYIALQLKAVSQTFELLRLSPALAPVGQLSEVPLLHDTALYVALLLAGFAILFGTRHLDATERHEGIVMAIAFDAVIKLVAFVAVGVFVLLFLYHGFGDLFGQAEHAGLSTLFTLGDNTGNWIWQMLLSGFAFVLLPRQWQIGVVENVDEGHLKRAVWQFPSYLFVLSLFVLPIAAAGLLRFGGSVNADNYLLGLPISAGQPALALLVFIGGVSASTGMIIVETVALSTMVSNSLVLPLLLRARGRLIDGRNLRGLILGVRRTTIVVLMLLGFGYFRLAGTKSGLAEIGLVSFAAVAQFVPAIVGGLFWRKGTRNGAIAGLVGGFVLWVYTLLVPTFADSGWLPMSFLRDGPFGIALLRPQHLFGLGGMDSLSHGMFWTMLVNIGCYVGISLIRQPNAAEQQQAARFVGDRGEPAATPLRRGGVTVAELRLLLERFLGQVGAANALGSFAEDGGLVSSPTAEAGAELVAHAETVLAGSVGTVSARIMFASFIGEEQLRVEEIIEMLDEASQVAALEERHRLARELHDSVSQALFSMTLHTRAVELAVQREGSDPDGPVARGLAELRQLTQGALAEMRASLYQLRPDGLREDGLAEAVRKQAAAIANREGLEVHVHAPEYRLSLDERAEEDLFRVVQEAVHNSVKHASPSRIDIRLDEGSGVEGALQIEIADDGVGFDPKTTRSGGMGLTGMRERMERLGGVLVIDSRPAGSTTVRATLPSERRGPLGGGTEYGSDRGAA